MSVDGNPVLRTFSYGGGVQSTAALVLAARGVIDFPTFLFSNVGDDSEHPATLDYVRDIAMPYGAEHGIEVIELRRRRRDGSVDTLLRAVVEDGSINPSIPVRAANGAPGARSCTANFKIQVVAKWLKAAGATPDNPAVVGIGISTDEAHRASNKRVSPHEVVVYPLIELGYDRSACAELIRQEGLPVPRKSACFFCPFHTIDTWREMRRDEPELWQRSVDLERLLNDRRAGVPCPGSGEFPMESFATRCALHPLSVRGGFYCDGSESDECVEVEVFVGVSPRGTTTCPKCRTETPVGISGRLRSHGKAPIFFTSRCVPLDQLPEAQTPLFHGAGPSEGGVETCDAFSCMT